MNEWEEEAMYYREPSEEVGAETSQPAPEPEPDADETTQLKSEVEQLKAQIEALKRQAGGGGLEPDIDLDPEEDIPEPYRRILDENPEAEEITKAVLAKQEAEARKQEQLVQRILDRANQQMTQLYGRTMTEAEQQQALQVIYSLPTDQRKSLLAEERAKNLARVAYGIAYAFAAGSRGPHEPLHDAPEIGAPAAAGRPRDERAIPKEKLESWRIARQLCPTLTPEEFLTGEVKGR